MTIGECEGIENVDIEKWPTHNRWKVINELLEAELLTLSEVDNGFQLQEVDVVEVEQLPEEDEAYATKV